MEVIQRQGSDIWGWADRGDQKWSCNRVSYPYADKNGFRVSLSNADTDTNLNF
jgi:hypothetical protein